MDMRLRCCLCWALFWWYDPYQVHLWHFFKHNLRQHLLGSISAYRLENVMCEFVIFVNFRKLIWQGNTYFLYVSHTIRVYWYENSLIALNRSWLLVAKYIAVMTSIATFLQKLKLKRHAWWYICSLWNMVTINPDLWHVLRQALYQTNFNLFK